jgi:arabinan endo-1,5-alpha-L-arabinosidase
VTCVPTIAPYRWACGSGYKSTREESFTTVRIPGDLGHGLFSRRDLLSLSLAAAGAAFLPRQGRSAAPMSINERMSGDFSPVHDPCIIKAGDTYHLFCTGHQTGEAGFIPWRSSTDLVTWKSHGHVFESIPEWARDAVPNTRSMWAPDITFIDGRYHLYYSVSTFGSNRSVIGLATNVTLDREAKKFGWRDEGLVVSSDRGDDFNAIDPNHIIDRDGHHWLCLGSFWSGIKLVPLEGATGKPPKGGRQIFSLASRPVPKGAPGAIEAPFIIERGGFYYLFTAFDYCCRGASSSYYIVVGRSANIQGPYAGADGRTMLEGYGTLVLQGNRRYRGPGHPAVLRDSGTDYLVYHAYDAEQEGKPVLRISPIVWTSDGWPTVTL